MTGILNGYKRKTTESGGVFLPGYFEISDNLVGKFDLVMNINIQDLLFIFQTVCMCLSFIISLKLIDNDNIPNYLKNFYWYHIIGIIVLIPGFIYSIILKVKSPSVIVVVNISLLFHYVFLSKSIKMMMLRNDYRVLINIIFWIFFISILLVFSVQKITKINFLAFSIGNFGLIVFCVIYFIILFKEVHIYNLLNEPAFWIVTGVLFTMSVHIPILAAIGIFRAKISTSTFFILNGITAFCYAIMHLFFIKAYLCAIHPRKA